MFSIPVAGLAKAAIVATISLHPAAAHQGDPCLNISWTRFLSRQHRGA